MKLTFLLLFVTCFAFGQKQEVKQPVKTDTIKIALTEWQRQHIEELQAPSRKLVQEYLEAIISTVADPKKVRYGVDEKGRIIIIKQ